MAKKKKFKNSNAQLVGDTRLTQREMKKFAAAYFNVQRDNQDLAVQHVTAQLAAGTDIGGTAKLGDVDG